MLGVLLISDSGWGRGGRPLADAADAPWCLRPRPVTGRGRWSSLERDGAAGGCVGGGVRADAEQEGLLGPVGGVAAAVAVQRLFSECSPGPVTSTYEPPTVMNRISRFLGRSG